MPSTVKRYFEMNDEIKLRGERVDIDGNDGGCEILFLKAGKYANVRAFDMPKSN